VLATKPCLVLSADKNKSNATAMPSKPLLPANPIQKRSSLEKARWTLLSTPNRLQVVRQASGVT